jgi:hypothetical protein
MKKHYSNMNLLIEKTRDKIGKPISTRVVVATIESLGIREIDAMPDYGFTSIHDLSESVFKELTTNKIYIDSKNEKEREIDATKSKIIQISDYLWIKVKIFAEYYPLGVFNLLPVLIQIVAIIFFGYSLWTFVGFNQIQSTAVVLGVLIGLISTGGFVQVIGRQASFYWNYEDYQMTNKTINYLHKIGIFSVLTILFIIILLNFIFSIYPYKVIAVVSTYAFFIGILLLFLAPLHTIKQRWVITLAVFLGTSVAVFLKETSSLLVYVTHWIGIIVGILVSKVFLLIYFKKLTNNKKAISGNNIKVPVILYHNYEYFFYGMFIYGFIFIDRVLAWSSSNNGILPFLIYFEKNYELGMDLAILVFLLLAGVLEYSIASFTKFIDIGQKLTNHKTPELFNNQLQKMYWQQVLMLFITGFVAFILIYFIINASWGFEGQFNEVLLQLSIKVCLIGGIGYILLAWGMLNSLYLFTLGQAIKPLKAIIYAFILNLFTGFILSRFWAYEYSVLGMLCGAALFAGLTLKSNISFFRNLDYYYYAAY